MPRDSLEGSAYVLPINLEWDTVTNLEELASLEISSFAEISTIRIPVHVWSKLIRASNMIKRASEEEEMVKQELNTRLIDEHSIVLQHIQVTKSATQYSAYLQGCLTSL